MAISLSSLIKSASKAANSTLNAVKKINNDANALKNNKAPAPKTLLTRDKIQNSNSVTSYKHHWSLTLESMGKYSIPNPFSSVHIKSVGDTGLVLSNNLLPAISFRYDTYKISNEELSLIGPFNISIPGGYSYNKSITVSLFNDCQDAVRDYLRQYRESISPSFKTVRPYKDCCSKLVLYIYNSFLNPLDNYELWVIPDCSDPDLSDQTNKSLDITFNILGESDKNPAI